MAWPACRLCTPHPRINAGGMMRPWFCCALVGCAQIEEPDIDEIERELLIIYGGNIPASLTGALPAEGSTTGSDEAAAERQRQRAQHDIELAELAPVDARASMPAARPFRLNDRRFSYENRKAAFVMIGLWVGNTAHSQLRRVSQRGKGGGGASYDVNVAK